MKKKLFLFVFFTQSIFCMRPILDKKNIKKVKKIKEFIDLGAMALKYSFGTPVFTKQDFFLLMNKKDQNNFNKKKEKNQFDLPLYSPHRFAFLITNCVDYNVPIIKKASCKLKEKLTISFLDFQEEVEKKLKQKVDLFFEKKVSGTEKLIPFFEKKVRVFFEQLIDSYIKKASTKEEKEKFLQAKNININGALQLFFTVNDHFSGSKEEVLSYYNTIKKFSKISKNLHK